MKLLIVAIMSLGLTSAFAQGHDHHAPGAKKTEKHVESNKKFKPTEDLKIRMEKIDSLMKEAMKKKKDSKALASYGTSITETVDDIFKTCKLEPAADEAIHPSLALIYEGGEELKKGKFDAGHTKIHEALKTYENLFSLK